MKSIRRCYDVSNVVVEVSRVTRENQTVSERMTSESHHLFYYVLRSRAVLHVDSSDQELHTFVVVVVVVTQQQQQHSSSFVPKVDQDSMLVDNVVEVVLE